jgi:folate-binding protein YgfZ
VADTALRAAGYSVIGSETAAQLFVPAEAADPVRDALLGAGADLGLVAADAETLECLRVEAGEPLLGRELDGSVLPAEVGLDEAVSETKGCYTGQEVVARMRSRGRANHRLVGLRFESPPDPTAPPDRALHLGDKKVGEITSQVLSPRFGPIALAFVKADQSETDTRVDAAQGSAVVVDLPFR